MEGESNGIHAWEPTAVGLQSNGKTSCLMDPRKTETNLMELDHEAIADAKTPGPQQGPFDLGTPNLPLVSGLAENFVVTINVGKENSLLIWDPNEAVHVQQFHRIQGVQTGCFYKVPKQDTFLTLPLQLLPEEGAYLRDKGVAKFISEANYSQTPKLVDREVFQDIRNLQFEQQHDLFQKLRMLHLDSHAESVLKKYEELNQTAATEKGIAYSPAADPSQAWEFARKEILSEPLPDIREVYNMELPTKSWRKDLGMVELAEIKYGYPTTLREKAMYTAFRMLLDSGFTLTTGANYGVDFLLFKGDPHVVYSAYMVKVVLDSDGNNLDEYLQLGRVATTAKKALLWVIVMPDFQVRSCCSKWSLMK